MPVFRAKARVATSYEALSEHYYDNPSHAAEISADGTPPDAIVPEQTWVTVCSALAHLDSRERQIAVAHQAGAFMGWMARACRPAESSVVADWINPVPFAKLLKRVTWPYRFSAICRVERLDAPTVAKDFESLRVYFLDNRVFRQLEYTMEQIVGAPPGALRTIGGFCLGDAVVVEGPRPSGRAGEHAELIAHEVIHRIQCCHVGDTQDYPTLREPRAVTPRLVTAPSILLTCTAAWFSCRHIRERAIRAGFAVGQVSENKLKNRWLWGLRG